ncbi:Alpha/Beta hydrolase protein [Vararia minispora EC-137]|uniref:Alpha/Beta hydrolase protein n=1 Tax=Vararia minispora EC-137 TaxID=1314806 RepID=A0ACB8QTN7_9AGAM|nr:Alpha/Beta hydrolase protein [Vararia minispora EC-137]
MSNSLTRDAGLRLGPVVLDTFVRHYLAKLPRPSTADDDADDAVPLRNDELLYDEVFHIVKVPSPPPPPPPADRAHRHTVEELQRFSNTRTPPTPASHTTRITIPPASCDDAARALVRALGGEDATKRAVGGVVWWQVRGVRGVSAEWMCAKKDLDDARRRERAERVSSPGPTEQGAEGEDEYYAPEMDGMKCILYLHGGGYYFGSVDQERYTIQRMARKIHGRVLAVNYRLAPQYPFPCALHDALAAYLYLTTPPPTAPHTPIPPQHIIIAGDSAGGGLALALLQTLRDTPIPSPAGAILISPWCDLTHSFPSIFENTHTDVIPPTGLSIHKPSALWPPPPTDAAKQMRDGLRASVRRALRRTRPDADVPDARPAGAPDQRAGTPDARAVDSPDQHMDSPDQRASHGSGLHRTDATAPLPADTAPASPQLQLYAPNALLGHPLVSPAVGYLGGLPPLLFVASDREVLRDEIVYTAHRAAHPERFPISDDVRAMYPVLADLDAATMTPTAVHLQVYDGASYPRLPPPSRADAPAPAPRRRRARSPRTLPVRAAGEILLPRDGRVLRARV